MPTLQVGRGRALLLPRHSHTSADSVEVQVAEEE